MSFLIRVKSLIRNWICHLRGEATEQETAALLAEYEREDQEAEREYQELQAWWEAEEARHKAAEAEREQEGREYLEAREAEDRAREEQARSDQEWEEEQEHYRSHCPHCGTRWVWGRCPACDDAFGRN